MKAASLATQNILAAGQYLKFEFYKFALPKLGTFYFTNADVPLTIGGVTYLTGLTIARSAFTQATGLAVQSVDLTIQPQGDNPAGPVTLGGVGFLAACANGGFDGGLVQIYKGFFNAPGGGNVDVSPGIVPWFTGIIDQVQAGRFSVAITVNDSIQILNTQMPRNILQAGCIHSLFDAGCTLSKAAFTFAGTVTTVPSANSITASALTQADKYFALGIITFTSGPLTGSSYSIKSFTAATDNVTTIAPFATAPAVGNTFTIVPGCDKTQATCGSVKFGAVGVGNIAHYRGAPYVPEPETLYDGGTVASTAPTLGGQGGQGAGSIFGGGRGAGTYKP